MNLKRIALATVPALLVAGIVTVASIGSSGTATAQEDATTPTEQDGGLLEEAGDERPAHDAEGRRGGDRRVQFGVVAGVLGMTSDDLDAALQEGKTLAEIATDQGFSAQTVIDALVAEVSDRVDEAVANGRLTAEEAATIVADATDRITTMVNEATFVRPPNPIDTVAGILGMEPVDLKTALRDGSTISDLATENGIDPDLVIDTLTDEARTQIEAWVNGEARGPFGGRGGPGGHKGGHGGGPGGPFGDGDRTNADGPVNGDEALLNV